MACKASTYGVVAVISHVMKSNDGKPIAYASCSLTKSEKNYSLIEIEFLSNFFGIKKFHDLYGRKFTLMTNHKPLIEILGSKAKLLTLVAARFRRWAICLTVYNYDLVFRPMAKHRNADGLSHLPLEGSNEDVQNVTTTFNSKQIENPSSGC